MKNLIIILIITFADPTWAAAKLKDPNCTDVTQISERLIPQYLALVDGYKRAGKEVGRVNLARIIRETENVVDQCNQNRVAKLSAVRRYIRVSNLPTTKWAPSSPAVISPTKARCHDFSALNENLQPVAIYWVVGYSRLGVTKNGEVDNLFFSQPIDTLVEECAAVPNASFYGRTRDWMKNRIRVSRF
jgi:acid stress chaperone HdeA